MKKTLLRLLGLFVILSLAWFWIMLTASPAFAGIFN